MSHAGKRERKIIHKRICMKTISTFLTNLAHGYFTYYITGDPALPPEIPSSAFNGSSDGTIHQETSSGISSAATDKFPPDNPSDCDSLDGGPMIHHSLKYRHRLHPPMYPGDSSDPMDIAVAGGDVEDDKGKCGCR